MRTAGIRGDAGGLRAATIRRPAGQANGGVCMGIVAGKQAADYELARGSAAGDAGAFEALYRRHFRRVYSLCVRMTANTHEAEDLTQEVFVNLYTKIGSFRGGSAFTTWLHRVTVNQVLMNLRKRKTRPEESLKEESAMQAALKVKRPSGLPVIDRIALERAVARLPRGYRTVFGLHVVEGYEHAEIARMLGISEGTAKSQLHKARLKLRSLILQKAKQNAPKPAPDGVAMPTPKCARPSRVAETGVESSASERTSSSISRAVRS
jgi:RNA polymerase sigma-70 factor (ECF subfamily)